MKILFYTSNDVAPQLGGTERITASISSGLRENGFCCYLVYDNDIDTKLERTQFDGKMKIGNFSQKKNVEKFKQFVILNGIDIIVIQGLFNKTLSVKELFVDYPIRIVFVHHFNPGAEEYFFSIDNILLSLHKKNESKLKAIGRLLLFPLLKHKYIKKLQRNYRDTYLNADKVVLLSKNFISEYCQYAGVSDKKKFLIIPNSLSFNEFFDMSKYLSKKKEVLIVSRLNERQKRITLALQIWHVIENNKDFSDWILRIVGDGPNMSMYKKLVAKLGLNHVIFEGRKDPRPYYRSASIFMMTSLFEGWGLTLTEAQQYGVVPVAFNSYASAEDIITDSYNGFLAPECDINVYLSRLSLLMSNYELRQELANNCIKSSKRFEQEAICKRWICLFEQ